MKSNISCHLSRPLCLFAGGSIDAEKNSISYLYLSKDISPEKEGTTFIYIGRDRWHEILLFMGAD
jgi:hypothetical protein